jgi:adenosylcobinamide kinase/adenosylcobinamide-phosphate guanylyltransferase
MHNNSNRADKKGELILVLGGARSGKSRFAQELALGQDLPVTYVASAVPLDAEMEQRIARHREDRPAAWETVEAPYSGDREVPILCQENRFVIWDCVTVFLSNLVFADFEGFENPASGSAAEGEGNQGVNQDRSVYQAREAEIMSRFELMLSLLEDCPGSLVIVANEVGLGIVPEYPLGRYYRDLAGRVNRLLAQKAEKVYFLIAGLPLEIKGPTFANITSDT